MSIAPIARTIEVRTPPAESFELFTGRMGEWWKGGTPAGDKAAIVVEPRVGGRWFERNAAGVETQWGTVLAWEPPARLLLGWQLDSSFRYDPDLLTEVELTFAALPDGGTRVRLEHRDLERFGADAERMAQAVGNGWPARLADFGQFTQAKEEATHG
ncbi:MAG: SRPBCC family protein [Acetobacteraceae bacterium]|nr:SRPBCC family protein [Acetobacteraceae bacterium]